jgi:hypothetical protein
MLASGTFGGLVVSMLASGTQDGGFAPGRSLRIYRAKNPQHRRFAACKRFINGVKWRNFLKIIVPFSPTVSPFATRSDRVDGDVEVSGGESGNG